MRPAFLLTFLIAPFTLLAAPPTTDLSEEFEGLPGCFYLVNVKTGEPLAFRPDQTTIPHPAGDSASLALTMAGLDLGLLQKANLDTARDEVPLDQAQGHLERLAYGKVEEGRLLVTPEQQARFMARFMNGELGLSREHSVPLFEALLERNKAGSILLGHSATLPDQGGAWYVGMVQMQKNRLAFATWLEPGEEATGERARTITLAILEKLTKKRPD